MSMVFFRLVAPADVDGRFYSTDFDKMFSDFEADSAAHINFKLSLSGFDHCCERLSLASAAATAKNGASLASFLLLPEQLTSCFYFCAPLS